ncbi:hypothetical protein BTHI11S_05846 [Bosea thiooxidans]
MVFQMLPSSSVVTPITSWQVSQTPGMMYWRMTRLLAVACSPSAIVLASASLITLVGCTAWAGVESR